ncbi:MAG: aminopeptidase [Erysipelotrichaceae bacterium]|nr:aminopeptidase [Erysipelotrichaceae bacterium]
MKNVWEKYAGEKRKQVMDFAEGYKDYLSRSKTEREAVLNAIEIAKDKGFRDIGEFSSLKPGDKFYVNNRDKNLALFVMGEEAIDKGMNILGAHVDSPRLDLKQHPLYEDNGLVLLDTHYYGGVKKYQWVAQPMALHGVVCKKDGAKVVINIGEKEDDPVIEISDLLIHLSADQMKKTGAEVVAGEDLNALFGSIPTDDEKTESDKVKKNILDILKSEYDIEEDDFISAELEIVPAGKARDLGLDRSMVMGYGHDDRICAYTSLMAILEMEKPARTSCCLLVDKEEIGSAGNTGMTSRFFENTVAEIIALCGDYHDLKVRRALKNSKMLSSDVSAAFDPNYPAVNEMKNTAFFGKGIVFNKYTGARGKSGSNDANAEYVAKVRKVMDDNEVMFQTAELGKVDQGGGGTIACILAELDMDVIDAGIAVQNMHACWETASKADIYEAYRGYKAFLKDMK